MIEMILKLPIGNGRPMSVIAIDNSVKLINYHEQKPEKMTPADNLITRAATIHTDEGKQYKITVMVKEL